MTKENTLTQSLKLVFISSGILFLAILLSYSFHYSFDLATLWLSLKSWLQPPYLYIIINAIIITIVASSRIHQHHAPSSETATHAPAKNVTANQHHQDVISVHADQFSPYDVVSVTDIVDSAGSYYGAVSMKDVDVEVVGSVEPIIQKPSVLPPAAEESTWNPAPLVRQKPLDCFLSERPPVTSRFGHHRKSSEGGKALRVAKPKKHDTFESTWKAITEGRHVPLTRHQKKPDTWQCQSRQINLLDEPSPQPKQKKSETFKSRANHTPSLLISSRLKKEPSLGQDELNRRVEAFIHKFNEDMRLQKQQSMQQFLEKINRAA